MVKARHQADRYARALPATEGRPPFLMIVDVGHCIELYSEFTRSGGVYTPFPDARSHRIYLNDLRRPELRDRLRRLWVDPLSLDPARRTAAVTREVAAKLAALARSLEADGHRPQFAAEFLMRCIFTMFAEDVELLPKGAFSEMLKSLRGEVHIAPSMLEQLWKAMDRGEFFPAIWFRKTKMLRFNGGLFRDPKALAITDDQLELLIEAAKADWRDVEPAIFGTLLERALDPAERHKLGAHYTPRAYVERLVLPTVIEPLRADWQAVQAAAAQLANEGKEKKALAEIEKFHRQLCHIRVLDPACGTGGNRRHSERRIETGTISRRLPAGRTQRGHFFIYSQDKWKLRPRPFSLATHARMLRLRRKRKSMEPNHLPASPYRPPNPSESPSDWI